MEARALRREQIYFLGFSKIVVGEIKVKDTNIKGVRVS